MQRRWIVTGAVAGMLALAGCGSTVAATSTPTTAPAPPATHASTTVATVPPVPPATVSSGLTAAQLRPELLSVTDLPAGWSSTPVTPGGGHNPCGIHTATHAGTSGDVEADFEEGQEPVFNEAISGYKSLGAHFEHAVRVLDACSSVTAHGIKLTVGPLSFPKVTPDSAAYQFSGTVQGFPLSLDIVVAAKGNQIASLTYGSVGDPDTTQLTSFARLALARLP